MHTEMSAFRVVFWSVVAALVTACPDDGGGTGGEGSTVSPTTGADSTTTSTTGGADAGNAGVCVKTCESPTDCCDPGAIGCPGAWPQNWECIDGFCTHAGCDVDAPDACAFGGLLPTFQCHSVGGVGQCIEPCATSSECPAGAACSGQAANGVMFCQFLPLFSCTNNTDCNGCGACNVATGQCGCSIDDQCTTPGAACQQADSG